MLSVVADLSEVVTGCRLLVQGWLTYQEDHSKSGDQWETVLQTEEIRTKLVEK